MLRPPSRNVDIEMPVVADYGILGRATTVETVSSDWWLNGFTHSVADANVSAEISRILGTHADTVGLHTAKNGPSTIAYYPFMVRTKVKGSTFGGKPEGLEQSARDSLNIIMQKAIEQEFWNGAISKMEQNNSSDGEPVNRFLSSAEAVDITPDSMTSGVKVRFAQALLEGRMGRDTFGFKGTIHAPREVASIMKIKDVDGVLKTNLGTSVIAGTGYTGSGPNGSSPAEGKYWIYGTGPVTVLLGDEIILPDTLTQAINTRNNEVEYIAEQPAAVVWSTQDVFAVLVDLNLDYA